MKQFKEATWGDVAVRLVFCAAAFTVTALTFKLLGIYSGESFSGLFIGTSLCFIQLKLEGKLAA